MLIQFGRQGKDNIWHRAGFLSPNMLPVGITNTHTRDTLQGEGPFTSDGPASGFIHSSQPPDTWHIWRHVDNGDSHKVNESVNENSVLLVYP